MCSRSECSASGWLIALIQNQRFQSVPFLAHLLLVQPNLKRCGAAFAALANVGGVPEWSISEQDRDVGGSGGENTSDVPDAFPAHLLLLHLTEAAATAFLGPAVVQHDLSGCTRLWLSGASWPHGGTNCGPKKRVFSRPRHLLLIIFVALELTNIRAFMVYVDQAKQ